MPKKRKSRHRKAPSKDTGEDSSTHTLSKIEGATGNSPTSSKECTSRLEMAAKDSPVSSNKSVVASSSAQDSTETPDVTMRNTGERRSRRKQLHPQKCLAADDPNFRGANIYMRPVLKGMESSLEMRVTFQGIDDEVFDSFQDLEVQPKSSSTKDNPKKLGDMKERQSGAAGSRHKAAATSDCLMSSKKSWSYLDVGSPASSKKSMPSLELATTSKKSTASLTSEKLSKTCDVDAGERKSRRKQVAPEKSLPADDPNFRGANIYMRPVLENMESRLETHVSFQLPDVRRRSGRRKAFVESSPSTSGTTSSQKDNTTTDDDDDDDEDSLQPMNSPCEKNCASCGVDETPLWRDAEDGTPLCNACGIRYKKYRVRCENCCYVPKMYVPNDKCIFCDWVLRPWRPKLAT